MEQILEGKSPAERANLKAEIIAQSLPLGEYEDTAHGLRIEIQGVSAMEGGVQIFARAWKETNQLGFGSDGSVEWERFRIWNPPVLVDDPNGAVLREWNDPVTGELKHRRLREDPVAATREVLGHADRPRLGGRLGC